MRRLLANNQKISKRRALRFGFVTQIVLGALFFVQIAEADILCFNSGMSRSESNRTHFPRNSVKFFETNSCPSGWRPISSDVFPAGAQGPAGADGPAGEAGAAG